MDRRVAISLFRHGLTVENERHAYIGWSNPSLSEKGRHDVQKMSHTIASHRVEHVFSSDLDRCVETAEILFPKQPISFIKELREMDFGKWDGKTYNELQHITAYRNWLDDPFEQRPTDGEDFRTFINRIEIGFAHIKEYIVTHLLNEVVIVTHGGVIRTLLTKLMETDKTFFEWKIPYSRGYRLLWDERAFRRGALCTSLQEVPITEKRHG